MISQGMPLTVLQLSPAAPQTWRPAAPIIEANPFALGSKSPISSREASSLVRASTSGKISSVRA